MTSGKVSKKIRKVARKYAEANWLEYVSAICKWPYRNRLRFAWDILFRAKRYRLKER